MSSIVRKKIWIHGGLQRKENQQKKTKEENDTENKQVLSLKAQTLNEKKKKTGSTFRLLRIKCQTTETQRKQFQWWQKGEIHQMPWNNN